MKIGIDARFWSQTGVGRYIRQIVGELAELDEKNDYVVYLMAEDFDKVVLPANFRRVKTTIRWHTLAEQVVLPILYLQEKLDVLVVLNFNVPIFYPKKFITTVHDLTLLRTRTGRATRLPYALYIVKYLAGCLTHYVATKRSSKLFTVSNYVKNDIVKTFGVKPEKIVLTPNAVDENFYKRDDGEVARVLQKYGVAKPYLFYVGNACTHKNLWRLVQAFDLLSDSEPNLHLVLGGKRDFNYDNLEKKFAGLKCVQKIKLIGFVADKDLSALYSGASLYVNPSMYEGFGIQILEAYACGCKVVCSNSTSLPEVGGDLADYFDPKDVTTIASTIKSALSNDDPRFGDLARSRVKEYSWKKSAEAVLDTIKKLCG